MKIPWRYLAGLAAGLCLGIVVFVSFLYLQLGLPTGGSGWSFAIIQRKKAFAASIHGPRLLLVAGSGTLYGINAELIEQQTGQPTVNLGSHAGLGVDYILHVARQVARPGDTVLLALEYEMYSGPFSHEILDDYILSRDPEYFRNLSWFEKIDMATRLPFKHVQKNYKAWRKGDRDDGNPDHISDHGDEIKNYAADRSPRGHLMDLSARPLVQGIPSDKTSGFDSIHRFLQWARDHRIRVLATFPNTLHRPVYDQPNGQHAIQVITNFYASENIPVIGTAQEAMLPEEDFFNSIYHLTHEAALQRTERLILELKPYLNPQ